MEAGYRKHYGWGAIQRSLAHFALGKASRMITSMTIFLVLVRELPLNEYAIYVSFHALIIAIGLVTSIGVQKVMFRYLPELRATGNNLAAYRLLVNGMLIRTTVVSLLFLVVLPFVPELANWFSFDNWAWLFPWYLLMGYLRLTALWLSQCLESFLWQKESQYSLAAGSGLTAIAVLVMAFMGELSLERVVAAEIAGESLALSLLLLGWWRRWRADEHRSEGNLDWWPNNKSRAIKFGAWGYLLSQSALFYGSAPNRLVTAHFLSTLDVAVLGATDALMNQFRKLVPTRMFMSMVRPLAMAKYAETGDFRVVANLSEFVFRLNLTILILPVVLLAVVGPELMEWVTDGKYAAAGYLLMGFLIVLIAEGSRDLVELMVQALEKNPIFFWTSLIQSGSLILALPLLPALGVWSLVVANFVGTVIANSVVIIRLRRQGYGFSVNLDLMAWLVAHAAVSGAVGALVWRFSGGSLFLTTLLICVTYGVLVLVKPPLVDKEKEMVKGMVMKRLGKKRGAQAAKTED